MNPGSGLGIWMGLGPGKPDPGTGSYGASVTAFVKGDVHNSRYQAISEICIRILT